MWMLLVVGCVGEAALDIPLFPMGGSDVSGQALVEQIPGKSGLGEVRWGFAADAGSAPLVGFVHDGRCRDIGPAIHTNALLPDDVLQQIYGGIDRLRSTIDAYEGEVAFLIHDATFEASPEGPVLACGDL